MHFVPPAYDGSRDATPRPQHLADAAEHEPYAAEYRSYAPPYALRRSSLGATSLRPWDSISNYGDAETLAYRSQHPHSHHTPEWSAYDAYPVPDERYESSPLSYGEGLDDLSRSYSSVPLMQKARTPASDRGSMAASRFSKDVPAYAAVDPAEKGLDIDATYPPTFAPLPPPPTEQLSRPPWWRRMLRDPTPLDQRIENYRRGIGVQDRPWLCWTLCLACVIAFICECANNWKAQGTPIEIHPTFNWLIGPSSAVLINSGARFDPCMKSLPDITDLPFACPNNTANPITSLCSLSDVCGFGGFGADGVPDQSFRFVLPIFLHVGVIHILVNMVVQLTSSAQIEREMGSLRFLFVYIPSGILGFILGGNFALEGQPSVGASGAIFGTHAAVLWDLITNYSLQQRPKRTLLFLVIEIVVGLGLGYIPGVDNFAHIGGFAMGLLTCILLYPSLYRSQKHRYIIYGLRTLAAPLVVLMFVLLIRNFYTSDPNQACEWCRYLSCWPTTNNNHCKGSGLQITTVNTNTRRFLLDL